MRPAHPLRKVAIVLMLGLLAGTASIAEAPPVSQPDEEARTFGDASARRVVDDRTRAIYDRLNAAGTKRVSIVSRTNPLALPGAAGTELTGAFIEGTTGRILATVWTKRGKYDVEFHQAQDGLLLVYETFAYFDEAAPRGAWHNFLGLPAWERRSYFTPAHRVSYAETRGTGAPAPGADGARLINQAQLLSGMLQRRLRAIAPERGDPNSTS